MKLFLIYVSPLRNNSTVLIDQSQCWPALFLFAIITPIHLMAVTCLLIVLCYKITIWVLFFLWLWLWECSWFLMELLILTYSVDNYYKVHLFTDRKPGWSMSYLFVSKCTKTRLRVSIKSKIFQGWYPEPWLKGGGERRGGTGNCGNLREDRGDCVHHLGGGIDAPVWNNLCDLVYQRPTRSYRSQTAVA